MITFVLASATGAALALHRLPTWARIAVAVVAVPASFVVLNVLDAVIDGVYTAPGWFAEEVPLVLAALVMAALGVRTLSDRREVR
jgi:hypothetical protein